MAKNKKSKKIFWLIAGLGLLSKIIIRHKKSRIKEIEKNFDKFLDKEDKEIDKLLKKKEKLADFQHKSLAILKDYFIPHRGNNHKPKILHHRTLIGLVVLLTILKVGAVAYLYFVFPYQAQMSELLTKQVIELTNRDRESRGLSALNTNSILNASAQAKADDMISKGYFAHTTPDGKKPWDFISRNNYAYLFVGENLAMNFSSARTVHTALMNSPSHRHNILNNRYHDIGVAMASGVINGKQTDVLVELFAVRAEPKVVATEEKTTVAPSQISTPSAIPVEVLTTKDEIQMPKRAKETKQETAKNTKVLAKESLPASFDNANVTQVTKIKKPANKEQLKTATIDHPGDQVFAKSQVKKEQINAILPTAGNFNNKLITTVSTAKDAPRVSLAVRILNYTFLFVFALLSLALLLKVFIRFHIQHKPIIVQSLLTLLVIIFLFYFKSELLNTTLTTIFII